ncbi:MAG TPA: flagellar hook capping FlgD N-terminal domain-containing protein [Jatrophihabitans sp.]|jgi:flagellar basal-body rod modification protein FlgD
MTSPIDGIGYSPFVDSTPTAATGAVDPTNTPTAGTTENDPSKPLLDPQAFLQLLVAQLQYQDPTSPADMGSFMTQTATLSQTQSITAMQQTMNSIMAAEQAQTATGLIGKNVTFADSSDNAATGVVSGVTSLATGAQVLIGNQSVPIANVTGISASSS